MASFTMPMPGPPTVTSVAASNAAAVITFAPPSYTGGSLPILGYVAQSSVAGSGVASGPASPLVLPGLANGAATQVSVAASNAAGVGPWSPWAAPVTPAGAPGVPALGRVTTTNGGTALAVAFTPSKSDVPGAVTYVAVANPGGLTSAGPASPLVIPGLAGGTAYTCTVAASNAFGVAWAATCNASAVSAPAAPAGFCLTSNPAVPTALYAVFAVATSNTVFKAVLSPGSNVALGTAPPLVCTITPAVTYTVALSAVNAYGVGPATTASSSNAILVSPPVITGVVTSIQAASINFGTPVYGACNITLYAVTATPGNLVATSPTSPVTFTGLGNGVTYTFSLQAYHAVAGWGAPVTTTGTTQAYSATAAGGTQGYINTLGGGSQVIWGNGGSGSTTDVYSVVINPTSSNLNATFTWRADDYAWVYVNGVQLGYSSGWGGTSVCYPVLQPGVNSLQAHLRDAGGTYGYSSTVTNTATGAFLNISSTSTWYR